MKTMQYEELPSEIRTRVTPDNFLAAYTIDPAKRIVVWAVNNQIEKQEELEYSIPENKILTTEERKIAIPPGKTAVLPELGVEVYIEYELEKDTNVLYEKYKIFSIENKTFIAEASQIYFSPYKSPLKEAVRSALNDYRFPQLYKNWSTSEKINYWVEALYRLRRQTGEFGAHEDDIFDKSLIEQMKYVDPEIADLIPDCLKRLANIEQIDESNLLKSFEIKTGHKLTSC